MLVILEFILFYFFTFLTYISVTCLVTSPPAHLFITTPLSSRLLKIPLRCKSSWWTRQTGRALIAPTSRQKESSFCALLPTRGDWLEPDKVQMELLGPVMRFPQHMFGLGDYRPSLLPRSQSHMHSHTATHTDTNAPAHWAITRGKVHENGAYNWALPAAVLLWGGVAGQRENGLWK